MPDVFIKINGVNYNQNALIVSAGRKFREAWVVSGGVVELDATKAADIVCELIDQKVDEICAAGIIWNGSNFGYKDRDDRDVKVNILNMLKEGVADPHNGYIKDMSGTKVTLTKVQAKDMLEKLRAYVLDVIQTSHDAKDGLPTDPAELEGFDPATDVTWPSKKFTYP